MNCKPYSPPVVPDYPRIERAWPFYHRVSCWEMDTYGDGWSYHPAPTARINRATEEDIARYMEAVRR